MSNVIEAIVVNEEGVKQELVRIRYINGSPVPQYYVMKLGERLILEDVDIAKNMILPKREGSTWKETAIGTNQEPSGSLVDIEVFRLQKLKEVGEACTAIIHSGIELNEKRYSLSEYDQIELMAQLSSVKEGASQVPYHADGELCRMYSADEFLSVASVCMAFIFHHRTYCNHLNAWIRRADLEELKSITYGIELPLDLKNNMMKVISEFQQ